MRLSGAHDLLWYDDHTRVQEKRGFAATPADDDRTPARGRRHTTSVNSTVYVHESLAAAHGRGFAELGTAVLLCLTRL